MNYKKIQTEYIIFENMSDEEFETICSRCGACCGAYDNDPCSHLKKSGNNQYYCDIYENRFGFHRTVNGNRIKCIPIKKKLNQGPWIGDGLCAYKNLISELD